MDEQLLQVGGYSIKFQPLSLKEMTLQQLAGIKPEPIDMDHAITLYQFLQELKVYEGYYVICMDVTINHKQKEFDSIIFHRFDGRSRKKYVHILEGATTNTALMHVFNSFYLLNQQRKKKERQSITPSYWIQILDEKYSVFAQMRTRKLLID